MRKLKKKISTSLDTLCQGLPDEFKRFIQYARDLKFEDRPDYSYLKNIIRQICEKNQLNFNYNKYDWILKKEQAYEEQKEQREKDAGQYKHLMGTSQTTLFMLSQGSWQGRDQSDH